MLNKRWTFSLIKITAAVLLLWFLMRTAQINMSLMTHIIRYPMVLSSVILIFLTMIPIGAWRWHQLNIPQGIHLGFSKTLFPIYISTALNILLPGNVGGDVARLFYLFKKKPEKKSAALLSIFFDRVIGFMAIALYLCILTTFYLFFMPVSPELSYLLFFCLLFSSSLLLLFFIFIMIPGQLTLCQWLNQHYANRITRILLSFSKAAHIYQKEKITLLACLIASVFSQFLVASAIYLIANMLGFPKIPFTHYIIAIGITQIVNLIPLTPGGIGIGETAFAHVLSLLNPTIHAPFATILFTYRLISLLSYLPGALYYLPTLLFTKDKMPLPEKAADTI